MNLTRTQRFKAIFCSSHPEGKESVGEALGHSPGDRVSPIVPAQVVLSRIMQASRCAPYSAPGLYA